MRNVLRDDDFAALRVLLESIAGLMFDESRRDSLAYSVNSRLEATGCADVPAYLALLKGPRGALEIQRLLDAVTIQETHFFRNPPQVRALRQHVLPELIRRAIVRDRPLTVWSAGCSTGEEPYTVAMLVREFLPAAQADQVRILATDVSTTAIAQAESGRYGLRTLQMAESTDVDRWFVPDGGGFRVRDEVRELVEFRRHNLASEPPPFGADEVDLLLCRNVTIYFSRTTTKALMARFFDTMNEGGYLFLGHSETLWQLSNAFTLVPLGDAFVYRKDAEIDVDRRTILPERRLEPDEPHLGGDRRSASPDRRGRGGVPRLGTRARGERLGVPRLHTPAAAPTAPAAPGLSISTAPTVPSRGSHAAAVPPGLSSGEGAADAATDGSPADSLLPTAAAVPPSLPPEVTKALPPTVTDALDDARTALAQGRYDDAVAAADAVTHGQPLLAAAHLVAGQALMNLDRPADAMVALRKATYLDPACAQGHLLLAGALERLGEHAAAARSYRAAAGTYAAMTNEEVATVFGGRGRDELVELCGYLARQAEDRPEGMN